MRDCTLNIPRTHPSQFRACSYIIAASFNHKSSSLFKCSCSFENFVSCCIVVSMCWVLWIPAADGASYRARMSTFEKATRLACGRQCIRN